jgi:hypothetical protein
MTVVVTKRFWTKRHQRQALQMIMVPLAGSNNTPDQGESYTVRADSALVAHVRHR